MGSLEKIVVVVLGLLLVQDGYLVAESVFIDMLVGQFYPSKFLGIEFTQTYSSPVLYASVLLKLARRLCTRSGLKPCRRLSWPLFLSRLESSDGG